MAGILGDSPDLGALADYLDFLDANDRRALGITIAPTQASTTFAPAPMQYAGPRTGLAREAPPPSRLQASMIPMGRAVAIPFGARTPSLLNPGVPMPQSTGLAPGMIAPPIMPSYAPSSGGGSLIPSSPGTFIPPPVTTDGGGAPPSSTTPATGGDGSGSSAQGASGSTGSGFGWLALAVGAYVMWRAL